MNSMLVVVIFATIAVSYGQMRRRNNMAPENVDDKPPPNMAQRPRPALAMFRLLRAFNRFMPAPNMGNRAPNNMGAQGEDAPAGGINVMNNGMNGINRPPPEEGGQGAGAMNGGMNVMNNGMNGINRPPPEEGGQGTGAMNGGMGMNGGMNGALAAPAPEDQKPTNPRPNFARFNPFPARRMG